MTDRDSIISSEFDKGPKALALGVEHGVALRRLERCSYLPAGRSRSFSSPPLAELALGTRRTVEEEIIVGVEIRAPPFLVIG